MNITENQKKLLEAFVKCDHYDGLDSAPWVWSLEQIWTDSHHEFCGTLTKAIEADLLWIEDDPEGKCVGLTEKSIAIIKELFPNANY